MAHKSNLKGRLALKINKLDDDVCRVIEMYVDYLNLKWKEEVSSDSDIVTAAFSKNFRTRLQLHHAANEEVFNKKSFEFAFKNASIAADRTAVIETSAVNPGHDVTVDGVRFSLKTEADKKIRPKSIKISKLMEARWIRECVTGEDFRRGVKRILEHLSHYERVLILRAFRFDPPTSEVRYDLLEIPLGVLRRIESIGPADFKPRSAKSGGSSALVKDPSGRLFALRLDGSVEKVTISGLGVESCLMHASWTISIPESITAAKEEGE
jgi:hypothetical protein